MQGLSFLSVSSRRDRPLEKFCIVVKLTYDAVISDIQRIYLLTTNSNTATFNLDIDIEVSLDQTFNHKQGDTEAFLSQRVVLMD